MSLQPLENKVLSQGIIRRSACMLAEITIRKSQVLFVFGGNAAKHPRQQKFTRQSPYGTLLEHAEHRLAER
jgi:hypothetical protein